MNDVDEELDDSGDVGSTNQSTSSSRHTTLSAFRMGNGVASTITSSSSPPFGAASVVGTGTLNNQQCLPTPSPSTGSKRPLEFDWSPRKKRELKTFGEGVCDELNIPGDQQDDFLIACQV